MESSYFVHFQNFPTEKETARERHLKVTDRKTGSVPIEIDDFMSEYERNS